MLNNMNKWIKTMTEAGIALLGLAIIVQILFGSAVPFFGASVIDSISGVLSSLGTQGMVGLLVIWVVFAIFNREPAH
jgi:hypothetical protein